MVQRLLIQILIVFILFIVFLIFYLKYYEKKGIYFPASYIEFTPSDFNLAYDDVYFLTSDGFKLNGWFIKASKPIATILFCHGNAGNISHRIEFIKMFNEAGFDVFIFDYRGYGKSEGTPSEKGLYIDALASYKYLVDEKKVSPDSIVVYGESIGGNVAIDLASKVKAGSLISYASFTSAIDMGKRLFPFIPRCFLKLIASVKFDAGSKIKNIQIPKLIMHSKDDEIVPFALGEKLFKDASPPKEFYTMEGGHNEAIFIDPEGFTNKIKEFVLDKSRRAGR